MDIAEIFEYLPHRYPFLLVDRVTEIEQGERITGLKNVSINEPFFAGHFPRHPIMPGVLIVEAMAQLAGILAFKSSDHRPEDGYLYYLAGIDKARFKRPVTPGDQLVMEARVTSRRRQSIRLGCVAHVDDELACSCQLTCVERKV